MTPPRRIAVVGAGRAGGAMAKSLAAAGFVSGLVTRETAGPSSWLPDATLVVLAVRDGQLAGLASSLAAENWHGKVALHLSGSQPSAILAPLRHAGASIGSLHPLTSLALGQDQRPRAIPDGTPFFGEGDPAAMIVAKHVALAVGGTFEQLATGDKPLYHAGATLAGNLAAVLHAAGGEALRVAGLGSPEKSLLPLAHASADAVAEHDGIAGLTGPLSRGDVATLRANIEALRRTSPALRRAHAATSLLGLELLEQAGRAPSTTPQMRALLRDVLAEIPDEA